MLLLASEAESGRKSEKGEKTGEHLTEETHPLSSAVPPALDLYVSHPGLRPGLSSFGPLCRYWEFQRSNSFLHLPSKRGMNAQGS